MQAVLDTVFWWTGLTVCVVALLFGLSQFAWWIVDRLHKDCGLWREFFVVMGRIKQERKDRQSGG